MWSVQEIVMNDASVGVHRASMYGVCRKFELGSAVEGDGWVLNSLRFHLLKWCITWPQNAF
jgi:hypothetical protein